MAGCICYSWVSRGDEELITSGARSKGSKSRVDGNTTTQKMAMVGFPPLTSVGEKESSSQ